MDNEETLNTISALIINNKQIQYLSENNEQIVSEIFYLKDEVLRLKKNIKKINIYLLETNAEKKDNNIIITHLINKNKNITQNIYILVIINLILCSYIFYKFNN